MLGVILCHRDFARDRKRKRGKKVPPTVAEISPFPVPLSGKDVGKG